MIFAMLPMGSMVFKLIKQMARQEGFAPIKMATEVEFSCRFM